jgi:hypothetical protein
MWRMGAEMGRRGEGGWRSEDEGEWMLDSITSWAGIGWSELDMADRNNYIILVVEDVDSEGDLFAMRTY